jgi:DNA-binding CsgD family transcriptional regulator
MSLVTLHLLSATFLEEFQNRCASATTLERLQSVMIEAARACGFRYVACGAHAPAGSPHAFALHNYPDDWVARAGAKDFLRTDPVIRFVRQRARDFCWDDPEFLNTLTPRERAYMKEARNFRITHGYSVPLEVSGLPNASLAVISESGDIDARQRALAVTLGLAVYWRAKLLLLQHQSEDQDAQLSTRERDCLELKAHGYDDAEIARRLEISPATVVRHLDQAKRRLKVTSREHAVYRGLLSGQIH